MKYTLVLKQLINKKYFKVIFKVKNKEISRIVSFTIN